MRVHLSNEVIGPNFKVSLHLRLYFVHATSNGADETERLHTLA